MGNEMGNSNTSALQEEENSKAEAPEKSLQEAAYDKDLEREIHLIPAENKDLDSKFTDLDSDDPTVPGDFQDAHLLSAAREVEEIEVHPPESPTLESPKTATKPNEVGAEDSTTQPDSLEENLSGKSDHQVETSLKKEDAGITNSTIETTSLVPQTDLRVIHCTNPFYDLEPHEYVDLKPDKDESAIVDAEPSVQVMLKNGINNPSETMISISNLDKENNKHDLLEKEMPTQEQNLSYEEHIEITDIAEVRDDSLSERSAISDSSNGDENTRDEEVLTQMSLIGNDSSESKQEAGLLTISLNTQQEVSQSGDKFIFSTEETKLVGEESNSEENKHYQDSTQSFMESVTELVIDESKVYHPENNEKNSIVESSNSESNDESPNEEAKFRVQESCNDSTKLALVPVTGKPLQDLSQHTEATPVTVVETTISANNSGGEKAKLSAFSSGDYETQGVGRLSTESNPDNLNFHSRMQKSPSFGLDLRIEARREESDRTPLLYQDKTAGERLSSQAEYDKGLLQYEEMSEEKNILQTLQTSKTAKSKNPFVGFLKEDEETHVIVKPVTPQTQEKGGSGKKAVTRESWDSPPKEIASPSHEGKERSKPKSSLFGKCMCCISMIN